VKSSFKPSNPIRRAGIVGDITPHCGISDEEKHAREKAAIDHLQSMLGSCMAAQEIESLWYEYEAGVTEEAKLVKDFDKIEMILQASEYENQQEIHLQSFFDSTAGKWRTDLGRRWAEEIYRRRKA
jgi:putative hydrolase of HD superfamily